MTKQEVKDMNNVNMVETEEQLKLALKLDHLEGKTFVSIGDSYYRICGPDSQDKAMRSCILWTKDNKDDTTPTWEKVVRIMYYSYI